MADIKKSNVSCCGSCDEEQEEKHGFWYRLFHRKNKKTQNNECECGHEHSHIVYETKASEPIFKDESNVEIKYAPAESSDSSSTVDLVVEENKSNLKEKSIPENQKHTIVSFSEYETYNYDQRRKDNDNWETIQLENGKHICYFCWIKKPVAKKKKTSAKKKVAKSSKK